MLTPIFLNFKHASLYTDRGVYGIWKILNERKEWKKKNKKTKQWWSEKELKNSSKIKWWKKSIKRREKNMFFID